MLGQYTGTPTLAMLFRLVVLSIPYIRYRLYRFFLLLACLPHCGLSRALLLAFWHSRRLMGIPLGNIYAVVVPYPRTGVASQSVFPIQQPVADRNPNQSAGST